MNDVVFPLWILPITSPTLESGLLWFFAGMHFDRISLELFRKASFSSLDKWFNDSRSSSKELPSITFLEIE